MYCRTLLEIIFKNSDDDHRTLLIGFPHWKFVEEVFFQFYYRFQAVRLLLDKGASVECKNNDGETALHVMARRRRLGCVIALLSSGANVNATSNDGSTSLHIAAKVSLTWPEWTAHYMQILFNYTMITP